MTSGWSLVARLRALGAGYPHILVDAHGWCLRLGPSARQDEKYYSNFASLLQGLVEHFLRRRMKSGDLLEGVQALARGVEEAILHASELSTRAKETVIHEHIRRCGAPEATQSCLGGTGFPAHVQSPDRQASPEPVAPV